MLHPRKYLRDVCEMDPTVIFSNEIDAKARDFALRNGDCHAAAHDF